MSAILTKIPDVVKRLELDASAERAFAHFTQNIHLWWPLARFSLGQAEARSVVLESFVSGRIYEILRDGTERDWGVVRKCAPPRHIAFSWVLERPEPEITYVDVRFEEAGVGKCVMTLVHTGWNPEHDQSQERRDGYDGGWDTVLAEFARSLHADKEQ